MISIKCSNCECPLIEAMVIEDNHQNQTIASIRCPYCNDTSYEKVIQGKFQLLYTDYTEFVDVQQDSKIYITVTKGQKRWKC